MKSLENLLNGTKNNFTRIRNAAVLTGGILAGLAGNANAELNIPTTYSTPNPNVVDITAPNSGAQEVKITLDSTIPAPYEPSGHTDFGDGWMYEIYAKNLDGSFMTEEQLSANGNFIPRIAIRAFDTNSPYMETWMEGNAVEGQITELYNITFPNVSGTSPEFGNTTERSLVDEVKGILFRGGDGSNLTRGVPEFGPFPLRTYFLNSNETTFNELARTEEGINQFNTKPAGWESASRVGNIFDLYQVDSHSWDGTNQEAIVIWNTTMPGSGHFDNGIIEYDRLEADLETVSEELTGFIFQGDVQRESGQVGDFERTAYHAADQLLQQFQGTIGNGTTVVYGQTMPDAIIPDFAVHQGYFSGEDQTTKHINIQRQAIQTKSITWGSVKVMHK